MEAGDKLMVMTAGKRDIKALKAWLRCVELAQ